MKQGENMKKRGVKVMKKIGLTIVGLSVLGIASLGLGHTNEIAKTKQN